MPTRNILFSIACLFILMAFGITKAKSGHIKTKTFEQTAQQAYDKGFAKQVMRGVEGSVTLWNKTLIETDSPGAGTSNKGAFLEPLYGKRIIKKMLSISEPRCEQATLVVFGVLSEEYPLTVRVNGNNIKAQVKTADGFFFIAVPPNVLKKVRMKSSFLVLMPMTRNPGVLFILPAPMNINPAVGMHKILVGLRRIWDKNFRPCFLEYRISRKRGPIPAISVIIP